MPTTLDPPVLRARAWSHAARPLAVVDLPCAPLGPASVLTATGRPSPALNHAFLAGPEAARDLRHAVAALGTLPATVLAPEDVAAALEPVAAELALAPAGSVPFLALELDCALAEAPSAGVERAVDADAMDDAAALVAAAFALRGAGALRPDLPDVPGADAWLLRDELGRPLSAMVATVDADLVGVWSMATPPPLQRRGHAGRLLRAVLGHYALEGATTACLVATPAGAALYRALGFAPAETWRAWKRA
jgi:GNAT superfamily N-acetyltransferase